ncbi:MAG: hypothetical protein WCK90_03090 [archaeon]
MAAENATREDALNSISSSENVLQKAISVKLPIKYINDSLAEQNRVYLSAKYAEVLRDQTTTFQEQKAAKDALGLVNWQSITYSDVVVIGNRVSARYNEMLNDLDLMLSLEIQVEGYRNKGLSVSVVEGAIADARTAFYDERLDDFNVTISRARDALETQRQSTSTLSVLRTGTVSVFQRYWWELIILVVILIGLAMFAVKRIRIHNLRRRIKKMKAEAVVLVDLTKKAQEERFNAGTLSALVYNTRVSKYQARMNSIKEELPVLEAALRKDLKSRFGK